MERSKRGIGTLIATAFMILVILFGFSVFFLMRSQAEEYQKTLESMNRLDWERNQEKAEIRNFGWDANSLNLTLENTGSIEIELAAIGVFNQSRQPINETSPYTPIKPYVVVNPQTRRTIGPYNFALEEENKTHIVQLVTSRGNVISETYPIITRAPDLSQFLGRSPIGWVTISFEPGSFRYTSSTVENDTNAWIISVKNTTDVMFWVEFRNHANQSLELFEYSVMQLTIYSAGSVTSQPFYIVDDNSNSTNLNPYNPNDPLILPRPDCYTKTDCSELDLIIGGNATIVKFASKFVGGDTFQNLGKAQYDMVIVLYYEYGPEKEILAQYIPFAGVIVTD
ncbi:MAG: hypothetical protein GTO54_03850 [Nitrososphaeria archaeon]|nr:hypothetical protein [Nitrososphaeria archaeon]